ncbi:MAG: 50S ribosomal protein L4 [Sphingomonadales bacterium]|nr:50S ribosomal protein L4 [Sphingomonadales bacterium]
MKTDVITLEGKKAGDIDLSKEIFGLEKRADILHRVVTWQLAKRRAGTHAVKFRSDIARTGARFGNQKGGGRARHGSRRSNIFIGGGRAFGPIPRDHGHSLNKKIRTLGLKTALSAKLADKKLVVVDSFDMKDMKTKALVAKLEKLGLNSALFIDGADVNENFLRAASNIVGVDAIPTQGANVYDILRRDTLVLSKAAVEKLGERLK